MNVIARAKQKHRVLRVSNIETSRLHVLISDSTTEDLEEQASRSGPDRANCHIHSQCLAVQNYLPYESCSQRRPASAEASSSSCCDQMKFKQSVWSGYHCTGKGLSTSSPRLSPAEVA
jgi:hypothetical protein